MSLAPGSPKGGDPRSRGHAATTCNVIADVTGASPQSLCLPAGFEARRSGKGRPRSECVVRRVSPHRAYLVDDDERCRVSVRSARVLCGSEEPQGHRNELAAGTAGHVPLPTPLREQSRGAHGTDGAARASRFWWSPRAPSRVGRGIEARDVSCSRKDVSTTEATECLSSLYRRSPDQRYRCAETTFAE